MTTLPIPVPDDEATDGPLDRQPAPVDSRHLPSVLHTAVGDPGGVPDRTPVPPHRSAAPAGAVDATPSRVASVARLGRLARRDDDRGQATAEYGLVILVAKNLPPNESARVHFVGFMPEPQLVELEYDPLRVKTERFGPSGGTV